jgi:hypothetical protein
MDSKDIRIRDYNDADYQTKLEVGPKNTSDVKLYEKNSFKLLGDYVVYIIRSHNQ